MSESSDDLAVDTCGGRDFLTKPLLLAQQGKYVVCGSEKIVTFFSTTTGLPVKSLHTGGILDMSLTENEGELVIASSKKVSVWNYETAKVISHTKYFKPEDAKNNKDVKGVFIPQNFTSSGDIYVILKEKHKSNLYRVNTSESTCHQIFKSVSYGTQHMGDNNNSLLTLAFDPTNGAHSRTVMCYDRKHALVQRFSSDRDRPFTIVRCHPTEKKFAVGDKTGRILIFAGMGTRKEINVAKSILHWHTLPVTALSWSLEGNHIYSGGGEHVLCKWLAEDHQKPAFIPRLSADIVDIIVSETVTAVRLDKNAVLLFDQQDSPVGELQGLSRNSSGWPAGLAWDARTQTLLLNGSTGHVQVFNPDTKDTSSIDITQQNFLTKEREKIPLNAEVSQLAVSTCGIFLATMDCCWTPVNRLNLKFWQFDLATQKFVLNTQVDTPHKEGAKSLVFKPRANNQPPCLLSVGNDKVSKIWVCSASSWQCKFSMEFRGLNCGSGAWSADGSVLAISFGQVITLWDNQATLKTTLTIDDRTDPVKHLVFGASARQGFYLFGASDKVLCCWDLLTLRRVQSKTSEEPILNLVNDADTGDVAVLTKDCVRIFKNNLTEETTFTNINTTGGAVYGKLNNHSVLFFITYNGLIKSVGKSSKKSSSESLVAQGSVQRKGKNFLFTTKKSASSPDEISGEVSKQRDSDLDSLLAVPLHAVPTNCALAASFISRRVKSLPATRVALGTELTDTKVQSKFDEENRIRQVFSSRSKENSLGLNEFMQLLKPRES